MDLSEQNHGSFKSELITGLCSKSSARSIHSATTVLTTKRAISLFKYVFAYLIRSVYIKGIQRGCQMCVTRNGQHNCEDQIQNHEKMKEQFYFCLHAIDKSSLAQIFYQCVERSNLQLTPVCLCVLHYKCLTIWRPLMRKQFLSGKVPNGISKSMCNIFLSVVQEWETEKVRAVKQSCTSC